VEALVKEKVASPVPGGARAAKKEVPPLPMPAQILEGAKALVPVGNKAAVPAPRGRDAGKKEAYPGKEKALPNRGLRPLLLTLKASARLDVIERSVRRKKPGALTNSNGRRLTLTRRRKRLLRLLLVRGGRKVGRARKSPKLANRPEQTLTLRC
jgi:hypothetical protein